ncbi:endocuticle structural glycoprotein SgAbd-8-like [Macrobrachium nipponense]|uniref:endocuticle structural glycoprotein SgAbd-8-like n=1 Tax=Macrobrachium nipponense TaxID=159736 RepID=UPI0030C846FB
MRVAPTLSLLFLGLFIMNSHVVGAVKDPYKKIIPILKDDRSQTPFGEYSFAFETGNGISREEVGSQAGGQVANGRWSYTSPEGVPVVITFLADQGGFQPTGAVIPVPPPLLYHRSGH